MLAGEVRELRFGRRGPEGVAGQHLLVANASNSGRPTQEKKWKHQIFNKLVQFGILLVVVMVRLTI